MSILVHMLCLAASWFQVVKKSKFCKTREKLHCPLLLWRHLELKLQDELEDVEAQTAALKEENANIELKIKRTEEMYNHEKESENNKNIYTEAVKTNVFFRSRAIIDEFLWKCID